jgi:hypothetical protein
LKWVEVVGDHKCYRPIIEREKGFEPSTSTLATCLRARQISSFTRFKVQDGAARSIRVV